MAAQKVGCSAAYLVVPKVVPRVDSMAAGTVAPSGRHSAVTKVESLVAQ